MGIKHRLSIYAKMVKSWLEISKSKKNIGLYSEDINFVLNSRRLERVHILLFYFIDICKINSVLKNNALHLSSFINFYDNLIKLKSVIIANNISKKPILSICDTGIAMERIDKDSKVFKIDINCFEYVNGKVTLKKDFPLMPYAMHPDIYKNGQYESIFSLRSTRKKIKIFFAGNISDIYYNNDILNKVFNIMTRWEIVNNLKMGLLDHLIEKFNYKKHIIESDFTNKLVLNVWDQNEKLNSESHIPYSEWLATISKSVFFLHCPGISVPQCHNQIESISVGCIPITEFPDMFDPPLIDGFNAITFEGEEGLIAAITRVLNLSKEDCEIMKNNVIDYYDNYLSPQKFLNKLLEFSVDNTCNKFYVISDYSTEGIQKQLK
ncbi:hypothetical protein [Hymenobacter tenuis]